MTPEKLHLKRATQDMIRGVGGLEAAAGFCRVGKSVLGDAQNVHCRDRFVAIDVVADLEPLARERDGWPHVTRALCREMGGVFVPLPQAEGADSVETCLIALASEFGDVAQAVREAMADKVWTLAEIEAATAELDQMDATSAKMRLSLKHKRRELRAASPDRSAHG
ncbi:MAG: hypothetical protein CMN73_04230 [Sphingomonas sp.]|nr:hypothetical protein [Sphingomonas sp.]